MKNHVILFCVVANMLTIIALKAQTETDVFNAIHRNDWEQVRIFIEQQTLLVNAQDRNGASPLMWATYKADLETAKWLLNKEADPNLNGAIYFNLPRDSSYYGSLLAIAAAEDKFDMLQFFVEELRLDVNEKEWNPKTQQKDGWNALEWACNNGNLSIAKYLINKGADPNLNKVYSLSLAVINKNYDVTKFLLSEWKDVDLENVSATALLLGATRIDQKRNIEEYEANYAKVASYFKSFNDLVKFDNLLKQNKVDLFIKTAFAVNANNCEKAINFFSKSIGDSINLYNNYSQMPDTFRITHTIFLLRLAKQFIPCKDYEKAHLPLEYAQEVLKGVINTNTLTYVATLYLLGETSVNMAYYELAESSFLERIKISKNISGDTSSMYAIALKDLAWTYERMGKFEDAISFLEKSMTIQKMLGFENSSDFRIAERILARCYRAIGQELKANYFLLVAPFQRDSTYGKNYVKYNLSHIDRPINHWEKLEIAWALKGYGGYYRDSIATKIYERIIKDTSITDSTLIFIAYNDLGVLYYQKGDYSIALENYYKALGIQEYVVGIEHPEYAMTCSNIGNTLIKLGEPIKAIDYLEKCLKIREQKFKENHHLMIEILFDLGNLYRSIGNIEKSESCFRRAMIAFNDFYLNNFSFLSENEKENFTKNLNDKIEYFFSYIYDYNKSSQLSKVAFDNILLFKSTILEASKNFRFYLQTNGNQEELNLYNQLQQIKTDVDIEKLNNSYNYVLDFEAQRIEKELLKKEKNKKASTMHIISGDSLHHALTKNDIAVEFISFHYVDKKCNCSGEIYYIALLLYSEWKSPKLIPLGSETEIKKWLDEDLQNDIKNKPDNRRSNLQELYNLIWQPLDTLLQGINTIYFSPAGLLHRVPFAALQDAEGHPLSKKYQLHQVLSTRVVADSTFRQSLPKPQTAVLFGGIDYDKPPTSEPAADTLRRDWERQTQIAWVTRSITDSLQYLRGSEVEVDACGSTLEEQYKVSTRVIKGSLASEEAFKALDGKPIDILHVATHGFSFDDPAAVKHDIFNIYQKADDPLIRSGLVMAGANKAWLDKAGKGYEGRDDGILTALEISTMHLSKVQLAVLSACDSGLGDIKGSEGVFGLQRALKIAGVKHILVTLWKISDEKTDEFMLHFYQEWLGEGKTIRRAFQDTQKWVRERPEYNSPYYWAGFVLVE